MCRDIFAENVVVEQKRLDPVERSFAFMNLEKEKMWAVTYYSVD
jgi:hypothetical protein